MLYNCNLYYGKSSYVDLFNFSNIPKDGYDIVLCFKIFFFTDHHSLRCSDFFQDVDINVEPIITLLAMQ